MKKTFPPKPFTLADKITNLLAELLYSCYYGDMETPQHGNASKKKNHKTNLMSSSLIKKKIF